MPILAKLGQKTIKNEQKQSILTQGGQKTIKIDKKQWFLIKTTTAPPSAAPPGRCRVPGIVVLIKNHCFFINSDCFLTPLRQN